MKKLFSLISAWLVCLSCLASTYYVAPNGKTSNSGTLISPFSLKDAVEGLNSKIKAGDTIILDDGIYVGTFWARISGTPSQPIKFTALHPGANATLEGLNGEVGYGRQAGGNVLYVDGSYLEFSNFEIKATPKTRLSFDANPLHDPASPTDIIYPGGPTVGATASSKGVKFINLIVHDTQSGADAWNLSDDTEISGCLIYFVGWDCIEGLEKRSHSHLIYSQSVGEEKLFEDNLLCCSFANGTQIYSKSSKLTGIIYRGNVVWNIGSPSKYSPQRNVLVGGAGKVDSGQIVNNHIYIPFGKSDNTLNIGYHDSGAGSINCIVKGNRVFGRVAIQPPFDGLALEGNTFFSPIFQGFNIVDYPNNTIINNKPTKNESFIKKNKYLEGKGTIILYNWENKQSENFDLSTLGLQTLQDFEIRDAQNYFGPILYSGKYDNKSVKIDLNKDWQLSKVIGQIDPSAPLRHSGKDGFFVFMVIPTYKNGTTNIPPVITPPTFTTLSAVGTSNSVTLSWDKVSNATGYNLYQGNTSKVYNKTNDVGNKTTTTVSNLVSGGTKYYFSVKAYNSAGSSDFSNEVLYQTPVITNSAPTITHINDITVPFGVTTNITYTIQDLDSGNISVKAISSNPAVITNIIATLFGAKLTPAGKGSSTISIVASDNINSAVSSFSYTVLPATVITNIPITSIGRTYELEKAYLDGFSIGMEKGRKQYIYATNSNAKAYLNIKVLTNSIYEFWFSVKAETAGNDSVFVSVDGQEDIFDFAENHWGKGWINVELNGRNGTDTALKINPRRFALGAGIHSIVIRARELNSKLDALQIVEK